MPNKPAYLAFLIEQLSPLGKVTAKAMFGGHCVYCDGFVFGLVANNELYLKADDQTRADFERRNLKPFHPFDKEEYVMSYYQAPPEIFEDSEALRNWCGGAIAASRRAKAPKRRQR